MKFRKPIALLVLCIALLSLAASLYGVFSSGGPGRYLFESIRGDSVEIHGKGLYQYDSVSVAAQGIAQDVVTVLLGLPLLLISLWLAVKGSFKGRLMLTGTLGYFLYTYVSYTFFWMYNQFFLVYVILMSASLYAFILSMLSFDMDEVGSAFKESLPVRFIGGFQIAFAAIIGLLWLGMIAPTLLEGKTPEGLQHYTTLVIQGMDLGFVVPTAIISGILILKRRSIGYLLSSIVIVKSLTMGTALTAMVIGQAVAGVEMGIGDYVIFPLFNLIAVIALALLFRNIKRQEAKTE